MNNRPVILLGNGVRGGKLVNYLCSIGVPVLTTWMGIDLVPEDSPVFCGRPGVLGQRAANIIQQKATQLYCFGARLDTGQVAYSYDNFAPNAIKHIYDVDQAELDKLPEHWHKHLVDLDKQYAEPVPLGDRAWLKWCQDLYQDLRPELESTGETEYVDPFEFISKLSDLCTSDDIIAMGSSGQAAEIFMQTFKVKKGQRIFNISTSGPMGADIPMAIGACIASGGKRTICVTGDGGFMLNVQELEVVYRLDLPIKFFVMRNEGYGSIRTMQDLRFGKRVGCDAESGFTLPDLSSVANSYDLTHITLHNNSSLNVLGKYLSEGFDIFSLSINPSFAQFPKVMSPNLKADPMEDMTPKLSNLKELMNV